MLSVAVGPLWRQNRSDGRFPHSARRRRSRGPGPCQRGRGSLHAHEEHLCRRRGPSAACQRRTLRRNATDGDDPMQQDPATRVSAAASSSSGPPVAQSLVVVIPPPTGSDVSGWASGMSNSAGPQRHEGTQPEAPHPSPPAATPIMHRCPLTGCPAADAARSRGWRSLAA